MKTTVFILCAASVLSGLPASALAVPLLWTLNGVTFTDGGTATGSFMYDVDTDTFSAVNIATAGGSVFAPATFTSACVSPCIGSGGLSNDQTTFLTTAPTNDLNDTPALLLALTKGMTDSGGNIPILLATNFSSELVCTGVDCSGETFPLRQMSAGSVSASAAAVTVAPVPALSTWGLMVLVLLLVALVAFGLSRQNRS